MSKTKWVIVIIAEALIFLIAAILIRSQEQPQRKELSQVVLVFDHLEPDGLLVVIPQGTVALGLIPFRPLHPAPLTRGDYMICRPFGGTVKILVPGVTEPRELQNIAFRCGDTIYQFTTLSITPAK